jgi:hypothetical protein
MSRIEGRGRSRARRRAAVVPGSAGTPDAVYRRAAARDREQAASERRQALEDRQALAAELERVALDLPTSFSA